MASFQVDETLWKQFGKKTGDDKKSAILRALISAYVEGTISV